MSRFKDKTTGVVFSVADSKDSRYSGPGFGSPDEVDAEPTPYDDLKAADLKAEIETRNEGRDDDAKIATTGNKAALIASLLADDASSAS